MKVVAARPGAHIDDPAQGASIFGLVAACLDLDLLDELDIDGLTLDSLQNVGRVDSIDDPQVLRGRGPVDRECEGTAQGGAEVKSTSGASPETRTCASALG
jgi:hypothetical protein